MKRKLLCLTALVTAGLLVTSVSAESGLADIADGVGGSEVFTAPDPAGNSFEADPEAEPAGDLFEADPEAEPEGDSFEPGVVTGAPSSLYGEGPDVLPQAFAAELPDEELQTVSCPEMGFSLKCLPEYVTAYDDAEGVTIYTENEGYIPYVMVYSSGDVLDPVEYIEEMFTPHIIDQYGPNLISYDEYDTYAIGGKQVAAGIYSYFLQGYIIDLIRVYDVIDGRGVSFTAKYIQDEREATLNALDLAVSSYVSDPSYYENGGTLPQPEGPQTDAPQPEGTQTDAPQPEGPQTDAPQPEEPQIDVPQPEGPQTEEPQPEITEPEPETQKSGDIGKLVGYHNDIKGFSFNCPEGISARTSDYGSSIVEVTDMGFPFILVSYNDWSNDGESYLNTIAKNATDGKMIVNAPVGPSPVEGNPGMYALMYSFMEGDKEIRVTSFTEEFDNGFMYFEARYYPDSDPELLSTVLATLLSSAQPDA